MQLCYYLYSTSIEHLIELEYPFLVYASTFIQIELILDFCCLFSSSRCSEFVDWILYMNFVFVSLFFSFWNLYLLVSMFWYFLLDFANVLMFIFDDIHDISWLHSFSHTFVALISMKLIDRQCFNELLLCQLIGFVYRSFVSTKKKNIKIFLFFQQKCVFLVSALFCCRSFTFSSFSNFRGFAMNERKHEKL